MLTGRTRLAALLATPLLALGVPLSMARAAGGNVVTDCSAAPAPPRVALDPADPPSLRSLAAPLGIRLGSALDGISTLGPGATYDAIDTDAQYRDIAGREFAVFTPENEMKWVNTEFEQGVFTFCWGDQTVAFAQANGALVRGHNLVWTQQLPFWLTSGGFNSAQLQAILQNHIETEVGHFRQAFPGEVYQWDVVNEPMADCPGPAPCPLRGDSIWGRVIGPQYISEAFRWAHEADPSARLFLNDYNIEGPGPKFDGLYNLVKSLVAQGVPIGGVGFEYHVGTNLPPVSALVQNMSAIAALGLQVAVTELDVGVGISSGLAVETASQAASQAAAYREVLEACGSVAACQTFLVWDFTDKYSWRAPDQPCIYDQYFAPKPAYFALRDALHPDFALSISPGTLTADKNSPAGAAVNVRSTFRFSGQVALSITGLGAGFTWSFTPATVQPGPDGQATGQLTLVAGPKVQPGTYQFQVVGSSGGLQHAVPGTFQIQDS